VRLLVACDVWLLNLLFQGVDGLSFSFLLLAHVDMLVRSQGMVATSSVEDFIALPGCMNGRVKHLTASLRNLQGQLVARP
jgi:hypothetical protein